MSSVQLSSVQLSSVQLSSVHVYFKEDNAETGHKGSVVLTKLLVLLLFKANSVEANDALEFLEGLYLKSIKCVWIAQLCVVC